MLRSPHKNTNPMPATAHDCPAPPASQQQIYESEEMLGNYTFTHFPHFYAGAFHCTGHVHVDTLHMVLWSSYSRINLATIVLRGCQSPSKICLNVKLTTEEALSSRTYTRQAFHVVEAVFLTSAVSWGRAVQCWSFQYLKCIYKYVAPLPLPAPGVVL